MDQEAEYPEEIPMGEEEYDHVTVAPPVESALGKYLREYRLLNSLLVSLFAVTIFLVLMWGLIIYVAGGGEGSSDFADAGVAPTQQKQKQQKVKLMQRQKKAKPTVKTTFRATTISDIAMPDLNEIDVKELAAVVDVASPETGEVSMNNDAMKSALKGIGLNLPKTMQNRCDPKKRVARLRSGGGKDITETAIIRGLTWLKNTQAADGSWGKDAKGDDGAPVKTDVNAMTSMALLSFLGHCELQDSPEFGPTVQKAINFLTASNNPPEKMAGGNVGSYSHPIRTYALCEAYTMTKIKKLELYAKRASEHVVKGQNENGGWAYGYGKGVGAHTDLSVTGWNIQALKAAAYTGISIDGLDEAMDKAVEYTKQCQDATGKFAYKRKSGGKPSLTGTGVLCLQIWKNAKSQEAQKGLEWIIANQATEWKGVNVYEWYYHAQACFQATGVSGGQKYWRAWNKNFQQIVCSAQESDGHWPHGAHYHGDSDIYRTTMTILMLEVYYRYMPTGKTG
ncbi:terpene cyclase/mutase family protein [Opitutales bacterium]|nr:terpene cyclase/mutase family protein [Opitutales bacterium]